MNINLKDNKNGKTNWKKKAVADIITLIIVFCIGHFGFNLFGLKAEVEKIPFTNFLAYVNDGQVERAEIITDSNEFSFKLKNDDKKYISTNPQYTDFKKDLLLKDVEVKVVKKFDYFNMIYKLLFIVFILVSVKSLSKQFKKIDKKVGKEENIEDFTFNDVIGLDSIKEDMNTLVDFINNPKKYKDNGAEMPKGVIFYGEPGTGKTLLAKAIAGETKTPFYSVSGSEFVELFVGQGASRVRDLFEKAKKNAPCIIFIDEIDAVGGKRGVNDSEEREQTLNQLLTELDGFNNSEGILVIGATNRLEKLDPALLRAGRFDKHIYIPVPETNSDRIKLIEHFTKNKKLSEDIVIEDFAKEFIGFSPVDIKSVINEAAIISVQSKKECIDKECIDKAMFKKLLKGHSKSNSERAKEELKVIANHEAGHALMGLLLDKDITKVTITSSTTGVGGVTFITPKKQGLHSRTELEEEIMIYYAGNIAERLLNNIDYNDFSTGASNDIERATNLIKNMVENFGMSSKYGLLNLNTLNIDNTEVLSEVVSIAKDLENKTKTLLIKNKELLIKISKLLLEKETLYKEELEEILKNFNNE